MKLNKWDTYFSKHLKPSGNEWGDKDFRNFKNWYFSWLNYIDKIVKLKLLSKKKYKVFEIGSSIGSVASLLNERGFDVTGSDISRKIIKIAGNISPKIPFIYCDIKKGIPGKRKYNIIVGFEVLEHVDDSQKAVANIYNGLLSGGYFIGSSPFPFAKNYADPTHCSVRHPIDWEKIFKEKGFKKVMTKPMSFLPFLWKLNKNWNIVFPFYVPFKKVVSTTLIIARK